MKQLFTIMAIAFFLTACTGTVRSYPQNDAAMKRQITKFEYTDSGFGGGPVTVIMSDGEILTGEYTTADSGVSQTSINTMGNTAGNTTATATAFGNGGMATGFGTTTATTTTSGSAMTIGASGNGMASLTGNKGTAMRCIYSTNNFTGKGTGTCETNKGEVYTIHF